MRGFNRSKKQTLYRNKKTYLDENSNFNWKRTVDFHLCLMKGALFAGKQIK